jgi:competence protein ComGC
MKKLRKIFMPLDERGMTLVDSLAGLVIIAMVSILMVSLLGNLAILKKASAGLNAQGQGLPRAYYRAQTALSAMGHPDKAAANARLETEAEALSNQNAAVQMKVDRISGNAYYLTLTIAPRGAKAETYEEVIYGAPRTTDPENSDETAEPPGDDPG